MHKNNYIAFDLMCTKVMSENCQYLSKHKMLVSYITQPRSIKLFLPILWVLIS